ncbi:MAG TPA: hypothetical protein DCX29_01860, partial [Hyphomonas sp.]|nr:hypothetical protein [Hyphomonas sp.]
QFVGKAEGRRIHRADISGLELLAQFSRRLPIDANAALRLGWESHAVSPRALLRLGNSDPAG